MWMWEQRDYARSSVAGRPKELGPGCAENDPAYSSYPIAKLEFGPAHADPASKQAKFLRFSSPVPACGSLTRLTFRILMPAVSFSRPDGLYVGPPARRRDRTGGHA